MHAWELLAKYYEMRDGLLPVGSKRRAAIKKIFSKKTNNKKHMHEHEHEFPACGRGAQKPCVVVIDRYIPQPDKDAGSRSMFHIIRTLLKLGMNVKFWPQDLSYDPEYALKLEQIGVEVLCKQKHSISFKSWLKINGHYADYFLLSRPRGAINCINAIRAHSQAKILYYGHDIHHLRIREQIKLEGQNLYLLAQERYLYELEHDIWNKVDVIYYPSESETEYVSDYLADSALKERAAGVRTIPLFAYDEFDSGTRSESESESESEPWSNIEKRSGILFVGGFNHLPNVDAAKWLTKEVMPIVRKQYPDIRLYLVGSNPPDEVISLANKNVTITGFISDENLAYYYKNSRLAVIPLRFGGGLKGKILEAMRYGIPVVTTTTGIQGLEFAKDKFLVADEPYQFASFMLMVLTDDFLWRNISEKQLLIIKDKFSANAMKDVFLRDIDLTKSKKIKE